MLTVVEGRERGEPQAFGGEQHVDEAQPQRLGPNGAHLHGDAYHGHINLVGARRADPGGDEHDEAGELEGGLLESEGEGAQQYRHRRRSLEHLHEGYRDVQVGRVAKHERHGKAQANGQDLRQPLPERQLRYVDPAQHLCRGAAGGGEEHVYEHKRGWVRELVPSQDVLVEEDDGAAEEHPLHDEVDGHGVGAELHHV